jgi:hypothetical protein
MMRIILEFRDATYWAGLEGYLTEHDQASLSGALILLGEAVERIDRRTYEPEPM